MKAKIIVLLLVLSAVLLSGCVGDEQPVEEPEEIPEENLTTEEEVAPEEVPEEEMVPEEGEEEVTPEENETSEEEVTPEEVPEEEVTSEGPTIISPETSVKTYTIRIDNFRATPTSLEIKKGDIVAWRNLQDRIFTLVSEEGLFENTNLVPKRSFVYTFNETGAYNFSVLGQGRMDVTITVEEP
ncbi:TPA: hypothetical protein HA351_03610 [Methanosarcinaceae archaeon]|nr:hypothetical protein [Methanosarcinaceae archaeon]